MFRDKIVRDKTVVVSDLHVDTWKEEKFGHFYKFLEEIGPETKTFVINGDLFDAPPMGDTVIPRFGEFINKLYKFAKGKNVYYFIGNHDLGIWGLRIKGIPSIQGLENFHIIYPYNLHTYVKLETKEGDKYIYFEHGHYFDPALSLYILNVAKSITPGSNIFSRFFINIVNFIRMFFGRPPKLSIDPGAASTKVIRAGQRRDGEGNQKQELGIKGNNISPNFKSAIWKYIGKLLAKKTTPEHWKNSAQDLFQQFHNVKDQKKELAAIIFGHTHVPSTKEEWLVYSGNRALYLNSGDWAEPVLDKDLDTHHSNFIIFDGEGNIEKGPNGEPVRDYIKESALKLTKVPS